MRGAETFALEAQVVPSPPPEPKRPARKEPEEASQSPFTITVGEVYDGPMDLLLDLIRKQNIDIYDIPIGRITAQFLEYTRHLQQIDVDAAGEFVYVASLLIHIKSKTLLPRDPTGVQGELPVDDPRRELVERLLEHERFKAAAQMLQQKQQIEEASWTQPGMRGFLRDEGKESVSEERELAADTVDLVRVFGDLLQRLRERPVHRIDEESVTVAQMVDYVKRRLLMEDRPVSPPAPARERAFGARADLHVPRHAGAGSLAGYTSPPGGSNGRHPVEEIRKLRSGHVGRGKRSR